MAGQSGDPGKVEHFRGHVSSSWSDTVAQHAVRAKDAEDRHPKAECGRFVTVDRRPFDPSAGIVDPPCGRCVRIVAARLKAAEPAVRIVPRWEGTGEDRHVVLFFPDMDAGQGLMTCYAHHGQHSSASRDYYLTTEPAPIFGAETQALVTEWQNLDPHNRPTPVQLYRRIPKDAGRCRDCGHPLD